jgi:hypothetical protein
MRAFFNRNKYYFLLLFIFLLSELIVKPFGNYPLNDDWSYAKSVIVLLNEGRVNIGEWPAMTLVSHITWGFLFVKLFGFSFVVLRLSTVVSMLIGLWALHKLVIKITNDRLVAFITCLTLLFNPIFFSVSNTFMTDVNFITLLILCFYFIYDFFSTGRFLSFLLVFILSIILVLLRQYGLIVPVCFTMACLFRKEKRTMYVVLAVVLTALVYFIFRAYENYLKSVLPPSAAYKFSGTVNPTQRIFWDMFFENFKNRYKIIILHASVYAFPVLIIYTRQIVADFKPRPVVILSILIFVLVYFLYKNQNFQVGNVFNDTGLGVDSFYETLKGTYGDAPHFYSRSFENNILTPIKYLVISWTLLLLTLLVLKLYRTKKNIFTQPNTIFTLGFFVAYSLLIIITETFFDRYQLPLILLTMVLFTFIQKMYGSYKLWTVVPLMCFMYVSIFGSKDYFVMNDRKWEAYDYLRKEKGIPKQDINGGFEIGCWFEGEKSAWYDFMELERYNYLIQYKSEEGFVKMKEYVFQRYMPYKKDTLRIYERVEKKERRN